MIVSRGGSSCLESFAIEQIVSRHLSFVDCSLIESSSLSPALSNDWLQERNTDLNVFDCCSEIFNGT